MRFSEEGTIFTIGMLAVFIFFFLLVVSDYWSSNQVRVMYQQVYQKSIECRIAYEGRDLRYIDSVCGEIPKFEDYQNK